MQSLKNKIILITGASSGIGEACARQFAACGARLILTARRIEKIKKLGEALQKEHQIKVLPIQLDVQDNEQVTKVIRELPATWQTIDILVNNAGLALSSDKIQHGDVKNWETMINTNILGLLYVTHAILPGMVARNYGHIINIGSVAGHDYYVGGNVYCATKHAVKAINKSLRLDLSGSAIRVTEINPGLTETEFSIVRWNSKERAKQFYSGLTPLCADDIADTVIYCATRPAHVNIEEIIIYPTAQASPNLIHKTGQTTVKGTFE